MFEGVGLMSSLNQIITELKAGELIPYLGPQALNGVVNAVTKQPIPADSDSLILAMNNGQPMSPKLMYEFPRAAMNQELKRGRSFLTRFLNTLYGETKWTTSTLHTWLNSLNLPYIIDINRDTQLQLLAAKKPHVLIAGISRMAGTEFRFLLYQHDGESYHKVSVDTVNSSLPIIFKPMGTPMPEPTYIASDADYVDYITELMGGFGIPVFLKEYRKEKRYLLLGLRLNRDTERMVLADIMYAASKPNSGYVLIPDANDKEKRFSKKLGLEVIPASVEELLAAAGVEVTAEAVA
jgi:hypothetical protein